MWRSVLTSLLALTVLTPGLLPYSAGGDCFCSEQACCRPARTGAAAPACHGRAPLDPSVLRCGHDLATKVLHVLTAAPLPARMEVAPDATSQACAEPLRSTLRDGFDARRGPPPRALDS